MPVMVAEQSKACTIFARSEAGIGSNCTQGMDVRCLCMCAFLCVCVQLITRQEVLQNV
jgi:hypothetical protein